MAIPPSQGANTARRVKLTGEVIDSWCQTTGIMYALGTAHHQCAIWCAVGGIPVVGNITQASSTNHAVQNTGTVTLAAGNMGNGASAAVSAMGAGSFVSFRSVK